MSAGELLASLASARPDLSGASCAVPGTRELFDAVLERGTSRTAAVLATQICARCPVLEDCGQWVGSLPAGERPIGVVAGARFGSRRSSAA